VPMAPPVQTRRAAIARMVTAVVSHLTMVQWWPAKKNFVPVMARHITHEHIVHETLYRYSRYIVDGVN
jgi:hypothetical protein